VYVGGKKARIFRGAADKKLLVTYFSAICLGTFSEHTKFSPLRLITPGIFSTVHKKG
jgi:hypothetical protein